MTTTRHVGTCRCPARFPPDAAHCPTCHETFSEIAEFDRHDCPARASRAA